MSIQIKLNHVFQEFTNYRDIVEVSGNTVRECLDDLICICPSMKGVLFNADDTMAALVVYHGRTILPETLDQPVEDPDEIFLLPLIYGG